MKKILFSILSLPIALFAEEERLEMPTASFHYDPPEMVMDLYPHHLKSWFWATRKLSKFADRKRPNINNIRSFSIDELRCFGAAENPTFEVVWVYPILSL